MEHLAETLRRLADIEAPENTGVISVYLDARAEASGERPAQRKGDIIVRDQLNRIQKRLEPRGPGLDSFLADRPRIEAAIDQRAPGANGLAIFACSAAGLFEVIETGTAFDTRVAYGPHPSLYEVARLMDEFEPAVVAVANTNTLKLFLVRRANVVEKEGLDESNVHFNKTRIGGWSQKRYQRHIGKHRREFAREAAGAIGELIEREGATRLIIAGDDTTVPILKEALPPEVLDMLVKEPMALHLHVNKNDVDASVEDILADAEWADSASAVDILVEEVGQQDLGVAG